jgi:hypothetical protein
VRLLVLPNLATYLELLREDLDPQKQRDEIRRYEAQRVYGLLQVNRPVSQSQWVLICALGVANFGHLLIESVRGGLQILKQEDEIRR